MRVILFVNGEIEDYDSIRVYLDIDDAANERPVVICCDGGLRHADALGLVPDCCIGDFDSAAQFLIDRYKKLGVAFIMYPPAKDQTDMELGIQYALELLAEADTTGKHELLIFGGLGGRFDHEMTNVYMLCQVMRRGVTAKMVDARTLVSLLYPVSNQIILEGRRGDLLSLIPLTPEVTGIVTEGLAYPLVHETLYMGYGRGLSNVLTGNEASVCMADGILMVVLLRQG